MPVTPEKQLDTTEPHTSDTLQKQTTLPNGQETAAPPALETTTPVAHVSPLCVFGLPPFWCIVTCPTCNAAGYIQEDVHRLPLTTSVQCMYGHTYRIELDTDPEIDEFIEST
jgi:hypothetical protein